MTPDQTRHYHRLIRRGFQPNQAMAIALGPYARFGFIGLKTTSTFHSGAPDPFARSPYRKLDIAMAKAKAERAGVSIEGKRYISQLADEPWDPKAWVSDELDIKRQCEARGLGCEGAVSVKAAVPIGEPDAPYRVDEKIVNREADYKIEAEKLDATPREREQIKDQVRTELSGTHYD